MAKVNFDISMSLDGFVTADHRSKEEPMGQGGEKLHEWAFGTADKRDREQLENGIGGTGAVITGRRNYDDSIPSWGADGPTGDVRLPVFVLSHSTPKDVPQGGVYTFVASVEEALERAKAAAGDKDVTVMGGAEIAQQFLRAGLIDVISVHLVPVLFGSGLRLFENIGTEHVELEPIKVVPTKAATHLLYRVIKS